MNQREEKKIYLDYAAATPLDEEVLGAMEPYFSKSFGNVGSLHFFGQEALKAVDEARERVASSIGADFREIIFTSSATESNNLAIRGTLKRRSRLGYEGKMKIVTSVIEHESVLKTVHDLELDGNEVEYLPVSREGVVDLEKLKNFLDEKTAIISVMAVNNQTGTIQPVPEISKIIKEFKEKNGSKYPLLHTDAVQAFQYLNCNTDYLGVDLMSFSSHKIYGPKGVGALYIRQEKNSNETIIDSVTTGGGQEFGLRSATPNVPGIVGFGKASEMASRVKEKEAKRIGSLKGLLWEGIKKDFPEVEKNGRGDAPHILNVGFPGHSSQDLIIKFDMAGLAVASGAACSTRSVKFSHVLEAMGLRPGEAGIIRFSLGKFVSEEDIKEALRIIQNLLGGR